LEWFRITGIYIFMNSLASIIKDYTRMKAFMNACYQYPYLIMWYFGRFLNCSSSIDGGCRIAVVAIILTDSDVISLVDVDIAVDEKIQKFCFWLGAIYVDSKILIFRHKFWTSVKEFHYQLWNMSNSSLLLVKTEMVSIIDSGIIFRKSRSFEIWRLLVS